MKTKAIFFITLVLFSNFISMGQDSLAVFSKEIASFYKEGNFTKSDSIFKKKIAFLQKKDNLEEEIYAYWDYFMLHPTPERLALIAAVDTQLNRKPKTENEHLARLHVQVNLGYHLKQFGAIHESIMAYEQAWHYYQKNPIPQYDIIDYCLKPLANNCTRIGDYTRAEEVLQRTLQLAIDGGNTSHISSTLSNLSATYYSLSQFYKAIEILNKALILPDNSDLQKSKLYASIAQNYSRLQNYKKALEIVSVSNRLLPKETKLSGGVSIKNLTTQAICFYYLQQTKKAFTAINEAIELAQVYELSSPREIAKLYTLLAKVFEQNGDFQQALQSYQNALQILLPSFKPTDLKENPSEKLLYPENTLIEIFDAKAHLLAKKSEYKTAIENYKISFVVVDLLRASFLSQEAKIIQQTANKNRTAKILALYHSLYLQDNNQDWIAEAFEMMESGKSSVLQDKLYEKNAKKKHQSDQLIHKRQQLLQEQANINNTIKKIELGEQFKEEELEKLLTKRDQISNELQVLKAEINEKHTSVNSKNDIVLPRIIQNLFLQKQTLISYFVGEKDTYIFTIKKNHPIRWRIISNATYAKSLQQLFTFYASDYGVKIVNELDNFKAVSLEIFQVLLQEEVKDLETEKLLIIPDGLLSFIPFDALLTAQTEALQFEKFPFLIKDFEITYAYATQILLQERPASILENDFAGFFPVFENKERNLTVLPYTLEEAKQIKKHFSSLFFLKEKASKSNFFDIENSTSIIHLATHANIADKKQQTELEFYDASLDLENLYTHNIPANLLVLSACETGIGQVHKGEGSMSLARGFSYAGVKNLVVSLWRVNDKATSILMRDFYKNLANQQVFEKALWHAKLNYLKNNEISNAKKSPYYWAGFVPLKNTAKSFVIQKETTSYLIYVILVLVLLFVVLFVYRKLF